MPQAWFSLWVLIDLLLLHLKKSRVWQHQKFRGWYAPYAVVLYKNIHRREEALIFHALLSMRCPSYRSLHSCWLFHFKWDSFRSRKMTMSLFLLEKAPFPTAIFNIYLAYLWKSFDALAICSEFYISIWLFDYIALKYFPFDILILT